MHSDNMKVSTGDLATYMQTMVDLLEDPLKLLHDPAAQRAVIDIKQVTRRIIHTYRSVHNVSQQRLIIHTYTHVYNSDDISYVRIYTCIYHKDDI